MALGSVKPEPGPGLRGCGETFPAAVSPPDQGGHCGAGVGGAMSRKLAEQTPFSWTGTWGNLGVPVTCPPTFCLLKGSGKKKKKEREWETPDGFTFGSVGMDKSSDSV